MPRPRADSMSVRGDPALFGLADEAYERYALAANRSGSYLTTYRMIVRKYPQKDPERTLRDLVARTPGDEGKWFAAAKEGGFWELAIELAKASAVRT